MGMQSYNVRAFHAIWFQELNEGRVTWTNEEAKLKYRHTLLWHLVAGPAKPTSTRTQLTQKKSMLERQSYNIPARLEALT